MRITLMDVAKRAQVSYSAVSKIINGGLEKAFAPETVKKVKAAAGELAHFLREVTGAEFPVVPASSAQGERQILVGRSAALDALDLAADWVFAEYSAQ